MVGSGGLDAGAFDEDRLMSHKRSIVRHFAAMRAAGGSLNAASGAAQAQASGGSFSGSDSRGGSIGGGEGRDGGSHGVAPRTASCCSLSGPSASGALPSGAVPASLGLGGGEGQHHLPQQQPGEADEDSLSAAMKLGPLWRRVVIETSSRTSSRRSFGDMPLGGVGVTQGGWDFCSPTGDRMASPCASSGTSGTSGSSASIGAVAVGQGRPSRSPTTAAAGWSSTTVRSAPLSPLATARLAFDNMQQQQKQQHPSGPPSAATAAGEGAFSVTI